MADIREFNHDLLDSLQERVGQWNAQQALGDVFANKVKFDKYNFYCSSYDSAADRLAKLVKANKKIEQFLQTQRAASGNQLDLPSLLIMPVQRIPRYKLLLEELLKHTPETHPDYKSLHVTLGQFKFIADLVNERIRDRQNRDAIAAVQRRISDCPKLEKEGRVFLKEGTLMKICRKEPKPREFFLFNDILLYASKEALSTKFHLLMQLETTAAEDVPDRAGLTHAFELLNKNKSFVVYASSADEKRAWLNTLQEAIRKRVKLLSRDHSLGATVAPVWVPDRAAQQCMLCQQAFTLTHRRHHCRRCGRCVCSDCSEKRHKINEGESPARVCDRCYLELQGIITTDAPGSAAAAPASATSTNNSSSASLMGSSTSSLSGGSELAGSMMAPADEDTVAKNLRRLTIAPGRGRGDTAKGAPAAPNQLPASASRKLLPVAPSHSNSGLSASVAPTTSTAAPAPVHEPTPGPTPAPAAPPPVTTPPAVTLSAAAEPNRPSAPSMGATYSGHRPAPPRPGAPPPRPMAPPPSQRSPGSLTGTACLLIYSFCLFLTAFSGNVTHAAPVPAQEHPEVDELPPQEIAPAPITYTPAPTTYAPAPAPISALPAFVAPKRALPRPGSAISPTPDGRTRAATANAAPTQPAAAAHAPSFMPPPGAVSVLPMVQVPARPHALTANTSPRMQGGSMPGTGYVTQPSPPSAAAPAPAPPPPGAAASPVAKGVAVLPMLSVPPASVLNNTGGGKKLWAKPPPRPKEPPPP